MYSGLPKDLLQLIQGGGETSSPEKHRKAAQQIKILGKRPKKKNHGW